MFGLWTKHNQEINKLLDRLNQEIEGQKRRRAHWKKMKQIKKHKEKLATTTKKE